MLSESARQAVDQYWSTFFGYDLTTLLEGQAAVVPHAGLAGYHGVMLFQRDRSLLVSVPRQLVNSSIASRLEQIGLGAMDRGRLRELLGGQVEEIVGPAFVGYLDSSCRRLPPRLAARPLGPNDPNAIRELREALTEVEWEHGGCRNSTAKLVGVFVEGRLACLSSYEVWGERIAHVSVVTHPSHRGRGCGKTAVSRLVEIILDQGLVPQYRTLESNAPSMRIAKSLGFQPYARTIAVRFISEACVPGS